MGTVEEEIYEAVDVILGDLEKPPKVFIVLFACALFIEGIDEKAVISKLSEKHPGPRFQVCLMNPISVGTDHAPVTMMYSRMAELFDTVEQENALNFIGNNVPVDRRCEIYEVLSELGVDTVNHPVDMRTFEEFRRMGAARWNLVIKPEGIRAAKELSPRMDYRVLLTTYDPEEIDQQYEQLFDMFGRRCDIASYREEAEGALRALGERLGSKTVALGSSATYKVFTLAKVLIGFGVNVTDIFYSRDIYDTVPPFDRDGYDWIAKHPEVRLHNVSDPEMIGKRGAVCRADIAIGFNAAYFTDTDCIAEISSDEGLFGYRGVVLLAETIIGAMDVPKDLRAVVSRYGLVI